MPDRKEFKPKPYTTEFARLVQRLIEKGIEQKEIAEKLEWDPAALSSAIKGRRDIPFDKWQTFQTVYKFDNETLISGELEDIIRDFNNKIKSLEAQAEVYKTIIASVLTSDNITLSNDPIKISGKIVEINNLIDDALDNPKENREKK